MSIFPPSGTPSTPTSSSPSSDSTQHNHTTPSGGTATNRLDVISGNGNYQSLMDDATVYGRLVSGNSANTQSVPFAYSRIPMYTIRAARIIDEFEKDFERGPDK